MVIRWFHCNKMLTVLEELILNWNWINEALNLGGQYLHPEDCNNPAAAHLFPDDGLGSVAGHQIINHSSWDIWFFEEFMESDNPAKNRNILFILST